MLPNSLRMWLCKLREVEVAPHCRETGCVEFYLSVLAVFMVRFTYTVVLAVAVL